jgi:RNA polymerase sigma-70 factor (ECF subfamily)
MAARITPKRDTRKTQRYDDVFNQTYQTYYTKIFAFTYSRVGNVELTKDITADVFLKAYSKGQSLRHEAALATWLFTIARNEVIGYYRRQKREAIGIRREGERRWLLEQGSDPEQWTLDGERAREIMARLRELSQRDQELLALKFDAELSYQEIGRIMDMSEVSVRVAMLRALRRLRERVERCGVALKR